MNGERANLIALALHGSAWLADPQREPPSLETNTTFQFIGRIAFDRPGGQGEPVPDSAAWFAALRAAGVSRLWLQAQGATSGPIPAHAAAAFVNSGGWHLLATGGNPNHWASRWEVVDRDAPDNRIWGVHVAAFPVDGPVSPSRPPVAGALAGLVQALTDVRDFASGQQLDRWAGYFDRVLEQAGTGHAEIPYHHDLVPPAVLSDEATHLLAVAAQAWVFGGMGSWNDVGVADRAAGERLKQVTSALYRQVLQGLVVATNSDLG